MGRGAFAVGVSAFGCLSLIFALILIHMQTVIMDLRRASDRFETMSNRRRRTPSDYYYRYDQRSTTPLVVSMTPIEYKEPMMMLPLFTQVAQSTMKALCGTYYLMQPPPPCQCDDRQATTFAPPSQDVIDIASTTKSSVAVSHLNSSSVIKRQQHIGVRKKACQLIGIDSHVDNHQRRTHFYGAWMRDGRRRDTRYYITEHYMGQYIFEYANRSDFVRALPAVVHQLPDVTFDGTNHVVFSRAFYFHRTGTNRIARYPLDDDAGELRERPINDALFRGQNYLYERNQSYSYFDFASDENGLWILYRRQNRSFLSIAKLDPYRLTIISTWHLHRWHPNKFINCFIVCGIVYAIDHNHDQFTIATGYDLYKRQYIDIVPSISWKSPSTRLTMAEYDHLRSTLNLYDNGYIYAMKLHLQTDTTSVDEANTTTTTILDDDTDKYR